jgi:glycerophosphoryl diester phosphodiesterase
MIGQERFSEINELLNKRFVEKKALIAVHRGVWGGNIIENTIPSFELTLQMGGDLFECDLVSSTDGVIYAFHDGEEPRVFGCRDNIKTMSSRQIDRLNCRNSIGEPSGTHVERFENILRYFNGDVLFNIDRAWDILPQVMDILTKYPYTIRQVIIKTPVKDKYLDLFNRCPEKYMHMPIVYDMEEVHKVLSYPDINTVGMEVIANTKDNELFMQENLDFIINHGLYVWVNTITLSGRDITKLFGDLDDDMAVLRSRDQSWGEVLRKGARILQTDWPVQLSEFRDAYFNLSARKGIIE